MAEDFSLTGLSNTKNADIAEFASRKATFDNSNSSLFYKKVSSGSKIDTFSYAEDVDGPDGKKSPNGITAVKNMIKKAVARHEGVDIKKVELNYWARIINNISNTYKVPAGLIVAIMEQEDNGKFRKDLYGGPMQLRPDAIQDFITDTNRIKAYNVIDSKLRNNILSIGGKSKNVTAYMNLAKNNPELGIMMGILTFKMKLMSAVIDVAKKDLHIKFSDANKVGYHRICGEAKEMLKNKKIKFTEAQAEKIVRIALKNYNVGDTERYTRNVPQFLKSFGVSNLSIINILINNDN